MKLVFWAGAVGVAVMGGGATDSAYFGQSGAVIVTMPKIAANVAEGDGTDCWVKVAVMSEGDGARGFVGDLEGDGRLSYEGSSR